VALGVVSVFTAWIGSLALAALAGGFVVVTVMPPGSPALGRRLILWNRAATSLLLLAGVGELALRTHTMAPGGLATAARALPLVLVRTHFGAVWIVRIGSLVALLALLARTGRTARAAACMLAVGIALTTALMGHAADRGDVSVPVLVDWIHVVAASSWAGTLLCLAALVLPDAARWPRDQLVTLMGRIATLAGVSLGLVVASGAYNACVQVGSLRALVATSYGQILLVKIALVAGMVGIGAANRFVVLPGLSAPAPAPQPVVRLARWVGCEALLALAVFGCAALLAQSVPARHASAHARVLPANPSMRGDSAR
jgi:copper resistance protein D